VERRWKRGIFFQTGGLLGIRENPLCLAGGRKSSLEVFGQGHDTRLIDAHVAGESSSITDKRNKRSFRLKPSIAQNFLRNL